MQEPEKLDDKFNMFPYDVVNTLAESLLRPNDGDVLFECSTSDDGAKKYLYAHSTILRARSKYYAQSNPKA